MEHLVSRLSFSINFCSLSVLWFFLCGIDRPKGGGAGPSFSTSDLQTTNLFQAMPPPSTWPLSFWIALFVLVFGSLGTFFGIRYLREKQIQEQMDAIVDEQASMGLETELESKQIDEEERDFMEEICGTDDPVELLPVVSSSEVFEEKVTEYKNSERFTDSGLKKIYDLRKHLGFSFKNHDWPFLNTQMLEKGQKLECELRYKSKNVVFITSILNADEDNLYIKPPTVKRRPANLKQFPSLHCRIRREKDADYEFELEVVDQLIDEMNAVILNQTSVIRKLKIRESERIPMDLEMDFQRMSEAQYDLEKKFDAEKKEREQVKARIKDMSLGGMKLQVNDIQNIDKGDILVFHLSRASLTKDLALSVMGIVDIEGLYDLHMKFKDNDTITRLKINQYLHRFSKDMMAMAS